eukprot:GHVT01032314.1.p1 GENE.GHVT01032314.1~~GHVT01032314.1.p1  ORF type:complete len:231 (-),score=31.76 GHVT01032314.1:1251-1943(-)
MEEQNPPHIRAIGLAATLSSQELLSLINFCVNRLAQLASSPAPQTKSKQEFGRPTGRPPCGRPKQPVAPPAPAKKKQPIPSIVGKYSLVPEFREFKRACGELSKYAKFHNFPVGDVIANPHPGEEWKLVEAQQAAKIAWFSKKTELLKGEELTVGAVRSECPASQAATAASRLSSPSPPKSSRKILAAPFPAVAKQTMLAIRSSASSNAPEAAFKIVTNHQPDDYGGADQ